MTIAEEMAEEFRVGFNSRKTGFNCWKVEQKEIKELIATVAERGREEAQEIIYSGIDTITLNGVVYVCSVDAQDAIRANKWEEEEA